MVNIGTVLGIGAAIAVGVGAYAVYRNLGKVGGAITGTVEKNISNPFGSWLDQFASSSQGAAPANAPIAGNPAEPAFGFIAKATAQTPDASTAITPEYAVTLTDRYGAQAQERAKVVLEMFAPKSQNILIGKATEIAKKSPTPLLTQAYSIVDQARVSVGGAEPLKNKFYRLFNLANQPAKGFGTKILPLSSAAVQFYAKSGIIAREVYL